MTSIDVCSSHEAGGSAIWRDTGVIVWKWPCVLPLVTCSSVMVTSHCWPFLYNYPCYLSNWHCLSLALTLEVLNVWCAWCYPRFLGLCRFVIFHFIFYSNWWVFLVFLGVLSIELYDQIPAVCLYSHTTFPFFSFYSMHQWNETFFGHLDFSTWAVQQQIQSPHRIWSLHILELEDL